MYMYSWCQHDRRLPGPRHVNPCAVLERPHSGKLRHRARASAMVGTLLPMDCVEIEEKKGNLVSFHEIKSSDFRGLALWWRLRRRQRWSRP